MVRKGSTTTLLKLEIEYNKEHECPTSYKDGDIVWTANITDEIADP